MSAKTSRNTARNKPTKASPSIGWSGSPNKRRLPTVWTPGRKNGRREFGQPAYDRVEAPATPDQKELLAKLSPKQVKVTDLAGEKIQAVLTNAPGNGASIGGLKVVAENGWFAARPSGTEDIYKIYAESFRGADHLGLILAEAQTIVGNALGEKS